MTIDLAYLSEQYRTELLGTIICFSQTVLHLILVHDRNHKHELVRRTSSSKSSQPSGLRPRLQPLLDAERRLSCSFFRGNLNVSTKGQALKLLRGLDAPFWSGAMGGGRDA